MASQFLRCIISKFRNCLHPHAHEGFYEIDIFGEHFTSLTVKSKENHSPVVTAYWPASLEQNGPICELCAGAIQYVFSHNISIIISS